jgi:protein-S-isoprenylcysteine O-methyltransferase Ste14
MILGVLLYFGGIAFYIWGRFTLGNMFGGSLGVTVQLYADHKLVTRGPFAAVRHPLYLGMMVATFGALLIYQNWAMIFLILLTYPVLPFRAWKEEKTLAKEFGQEWKEYCKRVPIFIPGLGRKKE